MPKKSAAPSAKRKGRKRTYIVRINVDTLRSIAVISLEATSRKEAVDLVRGAIELTGEVAPLSLTEPKMNEEIVEQTASEEVSEEVVEETALEVAEEATEEVAEEIAESAEIAE